MFFSSFSYCSLVWHFTTSKSRLKVEKIQERCLRLPLNNCINRYETLLINSGNHTVKINRLCILATEILTHKTLNLHVCTCKTSKYGDESHGFLGAYMWKSCDKMKKETSQVK